MQICCTGCRILLCLFDGNLLTAADGANNEEKKKKKRKDQFWPHLQHCHGNTSAHFESLNRAVDGEIMRNNPILQDGCSPDLQRLTCSHTV